MAHPAALFQTHDITLDFTAGQETVRAVEKANISIPEKAITIIYGPSGSGKSSLLNILSGLQPPSSGSLLYQNSDVYSQDNNQLAHFRAHELGIVYQTNYWVKSLNVLENISLPLYFLGQSRAQAHKRAYAALERINMGDYARKYPILLSGGEQQRIALARAIINDSPVVIADEPTGNLDTRNGDKIIELLEELQRDAGKTVILVTHNMAYLPIAHHLIEIEDGRSTEIAQKDIPKTVQHLLDDVEMQIKRLTRKGRK